MLSEAKHLCHNKRGPLVAGERSLRMTYLLKIELSPDEYFRYHPCLSRRSVDRVAG